MALTTCCNPGIPSPECLNPFSLFNLCVANNIAQARISCE